MEKERLDKLTWLILNHVISAFGLRMKGEELIYMYKIPKDGCTNIYKTDRTLRGGDLHIIKLTSDLNEVFRFVNLDRAEYEKGFKSMFEFNSWFIQNCSYLTRVVINSLEHGLETDSAKTDEVLYEDLKRFLTFTRLSHEEIRDNDLFPALLYYNLKEDIVRNFFFDEEIEGKFLLLKKTHLFKNELDGKFNSSKLVNWIPALKNNLILLNMFGRSFITFVTSGKLEKFPDYLVDNEPAEVRRDVLNFYEYEFLESDEYKIYILEGDENKFLKL